MYQKIMIIGNLGQDPEMRYMPDGTAVTNFSVATNKRWTDPGTGEPREQTTWFRVSAWGRQAETANEFLEKGRQVHVEGELKVDPDTGGPKVWTAQDGTVRASFEITARYVTFLSGGSGNGGGSSGGGYEAGAPQEEDEIPF